MVKYMGLDFETYSACDLPKYGLDRYVHDPTFRPLLASVAYYDGDKNLVKNTVDFVELGLVGGRHRLASWLSKATNIVAHNAPFEHAVLDWLGIKVSWSNMIDSAVYARIAGAASKLEAAAPQLLNVDKFEGGKNLIRLFSIPGKLNEERDNLEFQTDLVLNHPDEWKQFKYYCELDAELGLDIVNHTEHFVTEQEQVFAAITMEMSWRGWPVDTTLVEEMQRRTLENQAAALEFFRSECNAPDLNLNSLPQQKAWCADRGVRTSSFDEKNVERLLKRIDKKLDDPGFVDEVKRTNYEQVRLMLRTKQILGGSALKKLPVILDTVGEGNRLRDQYLHCGAGQSLRTTGRGVQLQNLKRIGDEPDDVETLFDDGTDWDNNLLAKNIRQVFTASHGDGQLIVGDFSSVESRGLAWLAQEDWKLTAFRNNKDLYKVLASKMMGLPYDRVEKEQRQFGKVGELSCGYQAGPGAVKDFAAKMGVDLSEAEATRMVYDWRDANPAIVTFWADLDGMLDAIVRQGKSIARHTLADGYVLELEPCWTPASLQKQAKREGKGNVTSILLSVVNGRGERFLSRVFHGCHVAQRNIRYYKPSELKGGDLWRETYRDPKTGAIRYYEIYGGKLAGILTQSFCRELFFISLRNVHTWTKNVPNVDLIGQFHDEIVLDWAPVTSPGKDADFAEAKYQLDRFMSTCPAVPSFPLAAEVKSDYRYTK